MSAVGMPGLQGEILAAAEQLQVNTLIWTINEIVEVRRATRADVITACTQILGQCIAQSGQTEAAGARSSIHALIDGYAMRVACDE